MAYRLTTTAVIMRLADKAIIPADIGNVDYQAYTAWLASGNTPEPVPTSARADLLAVVLTDARARRTALFSVVDGLQASALATGNAVDATAIEAFKVGLRNITKIDLTAATTEAAMRVAVALAYNALVAPMPLSVKLAFAEAMK